MQPASFYQINEFNSDKFSEARSGNRWLGGHLRKLIGFEMKRSVIVSIFATFLTPLYAQEHDHPKEDEAIHLHFYSTWMRPDLPNVSCCDNRDCYPTEAKFQNGEWYAKRREDGRFIRVPPEKIEQNRQNPDGRNHLCASPYNDTVYCFIPGGGT